MRNAGMYERELMEILGERFFCVRSAGSHNVDVLVCKGNLCMMIECKTTKSDVYRINHTKEKMQWEQHLFNAKKYNLMLVYAVRHIGSNGFQNKWFFFIVNLPDDPVPHLRINYDTSKDGNPMFKLSKGYNLVAFLMMVNHSRVVYTDSTQTATVKLEIPAPANPVVK